MFYEMMFFLMLHVYFFRHLNHMHIYVAWDDNTSARWLANTEFWFLDPLVFSNNDKQLTGGGNFFLH